MLPNKKRIQCIWQFGKRYTGLFLIAEICILVSYTVSLLLPLNLVTLTDQVLYGRQFDRLPQVLINYGLLFLTMAVFNIIYAFTWQTLQNRYVVGIKNTVFRRLMHASASTLSGMNSGDMMSRIDGDSEQFIHVIQRNVFHFINSAFLCGAILFMVRRIRPELTILLLAAALLPIILTRLIGRFMERYSRQSREITGRYTGRLLEILKGMRDIRLLNAGGWADREVIRPLTELVELGNRTRRLSFLTGKLIHLVNLITSLILYGVSIWFISTARMTIGQFLAVVEYTSLLHKKLNWMLNIYLDWFARRVSVDRVMEILDTEQEDETGEALGSAVRQIRLENVTFGYDGENGANVLENISFEAHPGQKIGIVGPSGVGKTTLTGLLMKMYRPQRGRILINGRDLQTLSCRDIRSRIGVVSQDVVLFHETIRFNLLLGNSGCTDEELWTACRQVEMEEVIKALPDGLDTVIGECSRGLSGGQIQRLLLARALLRDAQIWILDEATSALDIRTEASILNDLDRFREGRIQFVISHRLSAIRDCDQILLIRDGHIADAGTHSELIGRLGLYRDMFKDQAG